MRTTEPVHRTEPLIQRTQRLQPRIPMNIEKSLLSTCRHRKRESLARQSRFRLNPAVKGGHRKKRPIGTYETKTGQSGSLGVCRTNVANVTL